MALTCLAVMSGFAYYYFFSAFSVSSTTEYLYIDQDDNIDSVFTKLTPIASRHGMQGLSTLVRHSDYPELIKTGRYEITTSIGAFQLFRRLKAGMQSPVHLTVPSVRTVEELAEELTTKLMLDSATPISTTPTIFATPQVRRKANSTHLKNSQRISPTKIKENSMLHSFPPA